MIIFPKQVHSQEVEQINIPNICDIYSLVLISTNPVYLDLDLIYIRMRKHLLTVLFICFLISCASKSISSKRKEENLARNKFGIEVVDLDNKSKGQSGLSHGVFITNVYSFYPANKAGVLKGDIIVGLNDQTVFDLKNFNQLLQNYKYTYGQVALRIFRDNKIEKIKVYLE